MSVKTLQEAALELPPDERAELAQRLLLSLDDVSEEELAETGSEESVLGPLSEAKRRAGELDRGEVQLTPAEEVRRKARAPCFDDVSVPSGGGNRTPRDDCLGMRLAWLGSVPGISRSSRGQ